MILSHLSATSTVSGCQPRCQHQLILILFREGRGEGERISLSFIRRILVPSSLTRNVFHRIQMRQKIWAKRKERSKTRVGMIKKTRVTFSLSLSLPFSLSPFLSPSLPFSLSPFLSPSLSLFLPFSLPFSLLFSLLDFSKGVKQLEEELI